ncbi:hypothetical protein CEXT_291911 [Caerostris extrusa]|uniref:Uncharacterized protein n=1 Tax=Caerostris extrusa TaxID=172846 RepID=A0AAV4X1L8_CAEEX|nr:hypothetical protein CEXT_291911 [Caerostris extrusa]
MIPENPGRTSIFRRERGALSQSREGFDLLEKCRRPWPTTGCCADDDDDDSDNIYKLKLFLLKSNRGTARPMDFGYPSKAQQHDYGRFARLTSV